MDMNPKATNKELEIWEKVQPLQRKHIFTEHYGDGEIQNITRKNDLSGIFVYFNSNAHGVVKLDGQEFLDDVRHVRDIES